ncbi:MAG TPA: ribonuclease H-like domain-containing protein [Terriglobia bacterium]|nr:ribonuclease H-like domain-containing protein [Terriglobia bacterium]
MNLEEKLRRLRRAAEKSSADRELERQLDWLRRRSASSLQQPLPAQRVSRGIEHYVEGCVEQNGIGEYFVARQTLPFGRPYGKVRVADVSAADLRALELFLEDSVLPDASELVYLDTETTGLAGGTGTCAFLIGLGMIEGADFVVRQFFLRDYPDEKAILAALAQRLAGYKGLVTFNGKTFDVPLLETRYALARQRSPFGRMIHLDLLHPARRLWKLRLESCQLTHLEQEVLGITRKGDVPGSEIPGIYFDYLRSGDARGLQPVFYHNALDIITLAALTAELARLIGAELNPSDRSSPAERVHGLDLFSLSRIFERAGDTERSVSVCRRALDSGLPATFEPRALWHLAAQHKRRREYDQAVEIWEEIIRRQSAWFLEALEQLAIHAEHRRRDAVAAIQFTEKALTWLDENSRAQPANGSELWNSRDARERRTDAERFTYRLERLKRKAVNRC